MKEMNKLGISTVHINVEKELDSLGFRRMEVGLGRAGSYDERLNKVKKEIAHAETHQLPYSIHLPIYLYDWYEGDYLDAFYLDTCEDKRAMSYRLLEENLKLLQDSSAEYYVLHFQGVYLSPYMDQDAFDVLLQDALRRINSLAKTYDKKILLEYFGSNIMFSDYRKWTDSIKSFSHLGILMDTGHLYYASLLHNFDFDEGFMHLSDKCDAYHFWTTQGNKAYSESHSYKAYHHISGHPEQKKSAGWAFDTRAVFNHLLASNKPIVLEGTPIYEGYAYFYESIGALKAMAEMS